MLKSLKNVAKKQYMNPGNPHNIKIKSLRITIFIFVEIDLFLLFFYRGSGLHPGLYSYLQNSPKIAPKTMLTGLIVRRSSPSFLKSFFGHFVEKFDSQVSFIMNLSKYSYLRNVWMANKITTIIKNIIKKK